jgi:RimJ/RimL family protein N-acetyltransferase
MNTLQFRRAIDNDFGEVYRLFMHPSANPYLAFDIVSEEDFLPTYKKLLQDGDFVVVLQEERIIGMYHLFYKEYRQSDSVYLATLVIDPEISGKGYGMVTLQHIIQSMIQQKKNRIELDVSTHNEPAIRFYQKAGFEIEGTIKQSYKIAQLPGYYDDYRMAMLLPG